MADVVGASWRRILFVRTDRLGETVLTLPAVLGLAAALPALEITLLVHPNLRELIQRIPGIEDVWGYPSGPRQFWLCRALQLAKRLRSGHFDAIFISNPVKELHVAARLSGIPVCVGYNRKWGSLLTRQMPDQRASGLKHEVESNRDLIRFAGMPVRDESPVDWDLEGEKRAVAAILEQKGIDANKPFIVVHPYASHPKKEWLPQRYVALIREMRLRWKLVVVIVGQPAADGFDYDSIAREASAVNLIAQLTLPQLAALLKRATVLISSDSGPVHLAAAMGTPAVVLFGGLDPATGPQRWGPWGKHHTVIWHETMEKIAVDEVVRAAAAYFK